MTDKEKAIRWFENIADECDKLTSGNVAHLKAQIKGMAIRSAEYLKKQEPASEDLEEEIKKFYNFKNDAQITNNFNGLMKFAKHIIQWHSERIVVNKILDTRIDDKDFEREVEQTIKAQDLLNMLPHTLIKYTARHFTNWQKEQMMKDAIETTIDGKVVKVVVIDE